MGGATELGTSLALWRQLRTPPTQATPGYCHAPCCHACLCGGLCVLGGGDPPERSGRARPRVCAPDSATMSWSLSPMRWNTLRRCSAGVLEPSAKGPAAPAGGGREQGQQVGRAGQRGSLHFQRHARWHRACSKAVGLVPRQVQKSIPWRANSWNGGSASGSPGSRPSGVQSSGVAASTRPRRRGMKGPPASCRGSSISRTSEAVAWAVRRCQHPPQNHCLTCRRVPDAMRTRQPPNHAQHAERSRQTPSPALPKRAQRSAP